MTSQQMTTPAIKITSNFLKNLLLEIINCGYLISTTHSGNIKLYKMLNQQLNANLVEKVKSNKAAILEYWQMLPNYLSAQEQSLLFIDAAQNNQSPEYNMSKAIYLKENVDIECVKKAIKEIIVNTPLFTCNFDNRSQEPIHLSNETIDGVIPKAIPIKQQHDLELQLSVNANKPFDLKNDLLFRINTYQLKYGQFEICIQFTIHHIIFDGWSFNTFIKLLTTYYTKFKEKQSIVKDSTSLSYFDYCKWQNLWYQTKWFQKTASYWERQLAGYKHSNTIEYRSNQHSIPLNSDTLFYSIKSSPIKDFCTKNKYTIFPILISSLAILIKYVYNINDIIVGAPFSNRMLPETDSLLGYLANTLPIRCKIPDTINIQTLLEATMKTCNDAAIHQIIPFSKIISHINKSKETFQASLFNFLLALHNQNQYLDIPSEIFSKIENVYTQYTRFHFTIDCIPLNDKITFQVMYNTANFSENFAKLFCKSLCKVIELIISKPGTSSIKLIYDNLANKIETLKNEVKPCEKILPEKEPSLNEALDIAKKLQQIWQAILKYSPLPMQESFFSLGGTSILALSLINQINQEFSINLPVSWIFTYSTIKQQSIALMEKSLQDYTAILKFQTSDHHPPLILIPPSLVGAEFYHNFSHLFSAKIAFYSMENYNLNGPLPPIKSCAKLADLYNSFIVKEVDSCFLGGYCYGAIIALEMAHQLAKKNITPLTLYLIDPLLMLGEEKPQDVSQNELLKLANYTRLPNGEVIPYASEAYIKKLLSSAMLDREILYNYSKNIPIYPYKSIIFLTKKREAKTITYEEEQAFWQTHLPNAKIITIDTQHSELLHDEHLSNIIRKIEYDIDRCQV